MANINRGNESGAGAENTMTIGDLSEITGLSASAIRFYQRRGLLPARTADSGWQRFGRDTLDRLAVVELAKSAGFSLDEITRFLDALDTDPDSVPDAPAIWQGLAQVKIGEIEAALTRLQGMRQLLQDSLIYSYLSADRAHEVPTLLGWTKEKANPALAAVRVPASVGDLATD